MLPVHIFSDRLNGARGGWPLWSRDLDHFFDRVLDPGSRVGFSVDVREEGDALVLEAEVPGLTKDNLKISVEDGTLSITGEHKSAVDEEKANYHVRERRYGTFSRSFKLPSTADAEKIEANVKDGVLTLRIPTREEAKPREIKVK